MFARHHGNVDLPLFSKVAINKVTLINRLIVKKSAEYTIHLTFDPFG